MSKSKIALTYAEYLGTPEGDRLSTLAAGYRMTFREKVIWSETCEAMASRAAQNRCKGLKKALAVWAE